MKITARHTALVVISLVTLLAYATSFHGAFQFDDWNVIVGEPRVHSLTAWWQSMLGIRPLLKLSYALNWQSGAGLLGFHAVNLAIHIANAWLVYLLLRKRSASDQHVWAALFAALIFALHPAQTEAVTYICGRSSALVAFFSLASLFAWVAGGAAQRPIIAYVISPILFGCALATKETAIVLPVAMVLWRMTQARTSLATACKDSLAHWAVVVIAILVALATGLYRPYIAASLAARSVGVNALTQIDAVSYLVMQLVRVDRLNADPLLQPVLTASALTIVEALALSSLLGASLLNVRRAPEFAFATLWFFVWLSPTNSFIPRLDIVNDRQLYIGMIGPAWLLALALEHLLQRERAWGITASLLIVIGLALSTVQRNGIYFTEIAFWTDVTSKSPHNARAWNNLGFAYVGACDNAKAISAFGVALARDPAYSRAAVNLRLLKEGALGCAREGS
jgi:hypothetical protein